MLFLQGCFLSICNWIYFSFAGFYSFYRKAGGRVVAQPASVYGKLHHIVSDTFGESDSSKFRNNSEYLDKYFGYGGGSIDVVGTNQQVYIILFEEIQKAKKIWCFSSDAV